MGDSKRVLFISSYTESFDSVPHQIQGIKEILNSTDVVLDIEYMDTKRINTKENIDFFYTHMKYKLGYVEPYDAIIVGDDNALQFAVDCQDELFPQLPIIFFGINDKDRALAAGKNSKITGIIEETYLKDNIELALKFNPKAHRIVAIVDNTYTGIGDINQFMANKSYFPDKTFEIINSSEYTFDEIAKMIEALDNDSILLYLSMYSDKEGTYITISEAAEFLHTHAKIPVYRATIGGVGKGIIGGKMVSFVESGRMAAEMVLQVLNGTPVEELAVITKSPSYYVLDYKLLQKYNIDMDLVPPGTTFINKKVSFYEQYKQLVWTISLIITLLSLFSIALVIDNIKRRAVEKALKESNDQLTQTYEELYITEEELREQYATIQENANKIRVLNEKYELSISSTNSAVWEVNLATKEVYFSDNIKDIIHITIDKSDNIRTILNKVLSFKSIILLCKEYKRYRNGDVSELNLQLPILTQDKSTKWMMIRGKASHELNNSEILHGILLDNTKMMEQEIYIQHLAHHDYLTDLPNRSCFMKRLQEKIEISDPLSIIMIDIDNFKSINDTLGHVYGDVVLKEIAVRLSTLSNQKIFVSRFGGDEFLIMISDKINQLNVEVYIQQIKELVKKPFCIDRKEHYFEFSMGISRYPEDSNDMHQLIMNADTAMYQVKRNGKNGYAFYHDSMLESIQKHADIEILLRQALKEDHFYLLYQPRVEVQTGEIIGFEALLRIRNQQIPAGTFIKIAEESNLILEIGRKVAHEAIKQIADWSRKGFPSKILSINFSTKQLKDEEYLQFLKNSFEEYQVDPCWLEIEITESLLLDETSDTIDFLHRLREMGIKIAMDDFGTGYSSINYLTYLPVDHVKLDKSLIDKFLKLNHQQVIHSIIALVHSLNLSITAEGIEEREQYEQLKESDCDYIQGYYFSKPLEIEKADEIYNKNLLSL